MNGQSRHFDAADCTAFDSLVRRVLDGERPVADLDSPHVTACEACRDLALSARILSLGLSGSLTAIPPIDFASRIVPSVLARRQRERATRRTIVAVAASLAACVTVALFASPRPSGAPSMAGASSHSQSDPKPPHVVESFRLAGSAFVSLTKRAASESLEPAKNLFVGIERPDPPLPASRPPGTALPVRPHPIARPQLVRHPRHLDEGTLAAAIKPRRGM